MKSIFKILVLGVVPILAATAVVDQGLAADKGSQLIFHTHMAHRNFISVANANDKKAVTVLVQYYNDEMKLVLWYLRVLPAEANVLIDAFDHAIPGSEKKDKDGKVTTAATNVSEVLGDLPRHEHRQESRYELRPFRDRRHRGGRQTSRRISSTTALSSKIWNAR